MPDSRLPLYQQRSLERPASRTHFLATARSTARRMMIGGRRKPWQKAQEQREREERTARVFLTIVNRVRRRKERKARVKCGKWMPNRDQVERPKSNLRQRRIKAPLVPPIRPRVYRQQCNPSFPLRRHHRPQTRILSRLGIPSQLILFDSGGPHYMEFLD